VQVIDTIEAFRKALDAERAAGRTVGLVPTMGYLHEGHASLMRAAGQQNDVVAATIFVNPLQFGANEDLAGYPRDLQRDQQLAIANGVGYVFTPSVEEMYPLGVPTLTSVHVDGISAPMEGASRPIHFAGVATVVAKLFAITGPCRAYFGEKDYQQLAVIRRMAADLSFPVEVVGCPTIRESEGLAMSSRNAYLTAEERAVAPALHRALQQAAAAIVDGETDADAVRRGIQEMVAAEPRFILDYAEVADAATLEPVSTIDHPEEVRLLIAARLGRARLIDNIGVGARP
jgi:pantoate--beta-alanine ligase